MHGLARAFAWWLTFKMAYNLCIMADFQNGLISRIFGVFYRAALCTEQLSMICRMDFDILLGILIFKWKWGFCMS